MSLAREPEAIVARLRPHIRATFWPSVLLIVIAAVAVYFAASLMVPWQRIAVAAGGALAVILFCLLPTLAWLSANYTITTRRIIIRSGLLTRTRKELLHSRVYDVTTRQRGLQLLFRSADILLNTGLETPFTLRDVPSASLVQSALQDLMEENSPIMGARRQQSQAAGDESAEER